MKDKEKSLMFPAGGAGSVVGVTMRLVRPLLLFVLLGFVFDNPFASAQTNCATPGKDGSSGGLTGIINTYYPGTGNPVAGATTIAVGPATGAGNAIAVGDLLLVIQMQDASFTRTNSIAYGDGSTGAGYTAANSTGLFEYVKANSAVTTAGGTVTIVGTGTGNGLINAYHTAAADLSGGTQSGQKTFQVIRVPQYAYAVLNSGLTALAWNGSTGGVLAIDVSQDVSLNGTISVDGLGFRGAAGRTLTGGTGNNTDYVTTAANAANGSKGEGIAGTPRYLWNAATGAVVDTTIDGYPAGSSARGAPGNAGGGGTDGQPTVNDQNSGGGGGGNGGAGGRGGNTWSSNLVEGGLGGAVFASANATHLVMGGGGGSGTRNNDATNTPASSGSAGGGIVMIRARRVLGTGTITANGADAFDLTDKDGGGGAGAGGSIMVSSLSLGLTGLTAQAHGGNGGDAWNYQAPGAFPGERHGPGGGGGGGVVLFTATPASIDVAGGPNGVTTTALEAYNATPGGTGTQATNLLPTQIPGIKSGAECSVATFADITKFDALTDGSGAVYLRWQTGNEVDNLGFHVYRDSAGKHSRLNQSIIAGSALTSGARVSRIAGQSYAWFDKSAGDAGSAQYWLEDLDLNGKVTVHGPVTPVLVDRFPEPARALLLSEVPGDAPGYSQEVTNPSVNESPVSPVSLMRAGSRAAAKASLQAQANLASQWSVAAKGGVKLMIRDQGWYRVTQPELVAAGLDPSRDPRFLRLFVNGGEVAIFVNGGRNGRLEAGDSIEFYAQGLDTPFTDKQAYFLLNDTAAGRRINVVNAQAGMATPLQNYMATVERKDRVVYFAALRNGEADNWFGPVIGPSPVPQSLALANLDTTSPQDATLEVAVQGVTEGVPHAISVTINGKPAGVVTFDGQTSKRAQFTVPSRFLLAGANEIDVQAIAGDTDYSVLDSLRLTYPHRFAADSDSLLCTVPSGQVVQVDGFSSSTTRAFDVSDPSNVTELRGTVDAVGKTYQLRLAAHAPGQRTLYAVTDKVYKRPAQIVANFPSSLNQSSNGVDLVIISHRDFLKAMDPLKSLRQSQGLSVSVVDVEDLYDEFSYGAHSPYAIRDFLTRTKQVWKKSPRFVLLAGDASYDPRDFMGLGSQDLVPTKFVETVYMKTACDDWFGYLTSDGTAEVAVGRLPVKTADEAAKIVAKIVGYERRGRSGTVVLVADRNDGYQFEAASNVLQSFVPAGQPVQKIFRGQYDDPTAKSMILSAFNNGPSLVNYSGHGDIDLWRGEVFTGADALTLTNGPSLPFVTSMTCLNGFYQSPFIDSLAEALIKADRGGAVAVWASSALTEPELQSVMDQELYRQLFSASAKSGGITFGEAIMKAKATISDPDIRKSWILFGDPSAKLK